MKRPGWKMLRAGDDSEWLHSSGWRVSLMPKLNTLFPWFAIDQKGEVHSRWGTQGWPKECGAMAYAEALVKQTAVYVPDYCI